MFWKNLAPPYAPHQPGLGGNLRHEFSLKKAIDDTFVSFDKFKAAFNSAASGIQGSGWCWLVSFHPSPVIAVKWTDAFFFVQGLNPTNKRLEIATTPNQDPLLHLVPIIGVDMWEHAFYLQYKNVKADVRFPCLLFIDQTFNAPDPVPGRYLEGH